MIGAVVTGQSDRGLSQSKSCGLVDAVRIIARASWTAAVFCRFGWGKAFQIVQTAIQQESEMFLHPICRSCEGLNLAEVVYNR
jgi:hypothetical protein